MDVEDIKLPKIKLPKFKDLPNAFRRRINEYRRVFKITKKPTMEEFKTISKVAGIGTIIIGMIGFTVYMIVQHLR